MVSTLLAAPLEADITYNPTFPGRVLLEPGVDEFVGPAVLKYSWQPLAKVALEKRVYEASANQFGTPKLVTSFRAPWRMNQVMSNELFLVPGGQQRRKIRIKNQGIKKSPTHKTNKNKETAIVKAPAGDAIVTAENVDKEAVAANSHNDVNTEDVHENPFGDLYSVFNINDECQSDGNIQEESPKGSNLRQDNTSDRDIRVLVVSALEDVGIDFEHCDSAEDLCICLLHSMLGMSDTSFLLFWHLLMSAL